MTRLAVLACLLMAAPAAAQDGKKTFYLLSHGGASDPFWIDWNAGAKFARINYLIAREIADAPEAPRWYQGSFFGNLFAKDMPKAPAPGK